MRAYGQELTCFEGADFDDSEAIQSLIIQNFELQQTTRSHVPWIFVVKNFTILTHYNYTLGPRN